MSEFNHHGIEGQKWGVKNGPPYPLDKAEAKKVKKQALKDVKEAAKQEHKEYYKNYTEDYMSKNKKVKNINEKMKKYNEAKKQYMLIKKGKEWYDKHDYKNKPVYFNYIGGSSYAYFPKDKVTSIVRIEDPGTSYEYFNKHGLASAQWMQQSQWMQQMQQIQNEQFMRQAMNEPYLAGAVTGYSFAPF